MFFLQQNVWTICNIKENIEFWIVWLIKPGCLSDSWPDWLSDRFTGWSLGWLADSLSIYINLFFITTVAIALLPIYVTTLVPFFAAFPWCVRLFPVVGWKHLHSRTIHCKHFPLMCDPTISIPFQTSLYFPLGLAICLTHTNWSLAHQQHCHSLGACFIPKFISLAQVVPGLVWPYKCRIVG